MAANLKSAWNIGRELLRTRRDRELSRAWKKCILDDNLQPTETGGLILAHLREICLVDRSTIAKDKTDRVDALATAANEGSRAVWFVIAHYLGVDENALIEEDRKYQQQIAAMGRRIADG